MYILQECLFSFEEMLKIQPKERLPIFFGVLDLRPYATELRSRSPQGAWGHSREGIIDGDHVAIDRAAILAYEKKQPKRRSQLTGHANWSAKFDSFGNPPYINDSVLTC